MGFCTCGKEYQPGETVCEACGQPLPPAAEPKATTGAPRPRRRRRRLMLVLAVVLLLVAAALLVATRFCGRKVELTRAAAADTQIWIEVDARPTASRLGKMRPLVKAMRHSHLDDKLKDLLKTSLDREDIKADWEKDLKPWFGHQFAVAVSGLSAPTGSADDSFRGTVLALVSVRDMRKAEEYFADVARQGTTQGFWTPVKDEARGKLRLHSLRILDHGQTGQDTVYYAVADGLLYVSNVADEIPRASSRMQQGKGSLSEAAWFKRISPKAPAEPLALCYVGPQLAQLTRAMTEAAAKGSHVSKPAAADAFASTEGGCWLDVDATGISFSSYGFRPDKAALTAEQREALAQLRKENVWATGFTFVPANAWLAGSAQWGRLLPLWVEKGPYASYWETARQAVLTSQHFDLNADLLDWIAGVSIAVLGPERAAAPDFVLEARANRGEDLGLRTRKLREALGRLVPLPEAAAIQVEGESCTQLSAPSPTMPGFCYGAVDGALLVTTSRDALQRALRAHKRPAGRLTSSKNWQKAQSLVSPGPSSAWAFFLSPRALAAQLRQILPRPAPPAAEQALVVLKGIPWMAASSGADAAGYPGRGCVALDYPTLCTGLAGLLDAVDQERALSGPLPFGPGGGFGRRTPTRPGFPGRRSTPVPPHGAS